MTAEYAQSDQFRGARILLSDLAGLEIRDCEVSGLKIVDCYGGDVYLGGDFERLVVNDVDVTAYVEAELDRQHPYGHWRGTPCPRTTTGHVVGCHRDVVGRARGGRHSPSDRCVLRAGAGGGRRG